MDDPEPPGPKYSFNSYREKVLELVEDIDTTFSVDPGRIGGILNKPSKYFSTLKKLKKYIRAHVPVCAKVDNKNLSTSESWQSISKHSQLKSLRGCLNFRLTALNSKILPLGFR